MNQQEKARAFRALHTQNPLVLPNVWDAISARMVEKAGALALATTSAGISWSLGVPDGGHLERDALCAVLRNIVRVTDLPVSADIERGYGAETPDDVAETVAAVLDAGVVGVNLEDSVGPAGASLRSIPEQVRCIQRARESALAKGQDLFINARTDVYMPGVTIAESEKRDIVLERASAYVRAGADGVFVPGLMDLEVIPLLAQQIEAPLNIMVGPGAPSVAVLAGAGVARISTGPALTLNIAGLIQADATALLEQGICTSIEAAPGFVELNAMH